MSHTPPLSPEMQEISLKLERYDDIFSDFDIRPYSRRALSVDFLDEVKRAAHDKEIGGLEIVLYVPEKERSESHELIIKERLSAHFRKHHDLMLAEKRRVVKLGASMVTLGVLCMVVATFILFEDPSKNLLLSFLVVFLEPAAWFLLWEGMDQIVFNSQNINPELHFYKKMASAREYTHFKSY